MIQTKYKLETINETEDLSSFRFVKYWY